MSNHSNYVAGVVATVLKGKKELLQEHDPLYLYIDRLYREGREEAIPVLMYMLLIANVGKRTPEQLKQFLVEQGYGSQEAVERMFKDVTIQGL